MVTLNAFFLLFEEMHFFYSILSITVSSLYLKYINKKMTNILGLILSSTFTILSCIHFYWAFGGKGGFEKTLPTKLNGKKLFTPKTFDCIIVGLGLFAFSIFYLHLINILPIHFLKKTSLYIQWIIPSIFLLRAIGEFNYVGFFKKIKTTDFAKLDNQFFSPLCVCIAALGYGVNFMIS